MCTWRAGYIRAVDTIVTSKMTSTASKRLQTEHHTTVVALIAGLITASHEQAVFQGSGTVNLLVKEPFFADPAGMSSALMQADIGDSDGQNLPDAAAASAPQPVDHGDVESFATLLPESRVLMQGADLTDAFMQAFPIFPVLENFYLGSGNIVFSVFPEIADAVGVNSFFLDGFGPEALPMLETPEKGSVPVPGMEPVIQDLGQPIASLTMSGPLVELGNLAS
jgi:hypothetical protein